MSKFFNVNYMNNVKNEKSTKPNYYVGYSMSVLYPNVINISTI